jgi:hypothetical protein
MNVMEEIHRDVFYCKVCKATKDRRDRFSPIGILSMSSLPFLNILAATMAYLVRSAPLELQAGAGGLLFTAYLVKGVRLLGR